MQMKLECCVNERIFSRQTVKLVGILSNHNDQFQYKYNWNIIKKHKHILNNSLGFKANATTGLNVNTIILMSQKQKKGIENSLGF